MNIEEGTIRRTIAYLEERLNEIKKAEEPEFHFLQPVLVRDDMPEWNKAFYIKRRDSDNKYIHEALYKDDVYGWIECKADQEATTRINWIPWSGGKCPTDKPVLIKYNSGVITHWNTFGIPEPRGVIAYAILED